MFLSFALFIWLLFVSLFDFLCQLLYAFVFFVFDEIIVFCRFSFVFTLLFCVNLFISFSFFCTATHWLLVFCIFIYSCNYILVFFFISSCLFCITALSDVMISFYFLHTLLFSSYYIFILFVPMLSFVFLLILV